MEQNAPTTVALLTVSVFITGSIAILLKYLSWVKVCSTAGCRGLREREGVSVESCFLWTEIRAGSALITSMFTPTHLDHLSICRRWKDHIIRTRISFRKRTSVKLRSWGRVCTQNLWLIIYTGIQNERPRANKSVNSILTMFCTVQCLEKNSRICLWHHTLRTVVCNCCCLTLLFQCQNQQF